MKWSVRGVIDRLSRDLAKEFPKMTGFSRFNLYRMRMFFLAYSGADAIVAQPVLQLAAGKKSHSAGTSSEIVAQAGRQLPGAGVLGIIPGSMATPGFLVSGKGNAESLNSASHGAGRAMSRKAANEKFNWKDVNRFLKQQGVTLISACLDDVPMAYKNIREVMAAQRDLVTVLGEFMPKLVKMAPGGERPED